MIIPSEVEESRDAIQGQFRGILRLRFAALRMTRYGTARRAIVWGEVAATRRARHRDRELLVVYTQLQYVWHNGQRRHVTHYLEKRSMKEIYLIGLALDYCVKYKCARRPPPRLEYKCDRRRLLRNRAGAGRHRSRAGRHEARRRGPFAKSRTFGIAGGGLSGVASRPAVALREGWLGKANNSGSRSQRPRLQLALFVVNGFGADGTRHPDGSIATLGDGLAEVCQRSLSSHDDSAADGTTGLAGHKV
jgi:hypothetical protein